MKPGQTLRLGQVELKLEVEGVSLAAPAVPSAPPAAPAKKQVDATMLIPRGVSLDQLEKGGGRPPGFDRSNTSFSKKTNKANRYIIIIGIVVALVIAGLLWYTFSQVNPPK